MYLSRGLRHPIAWSLLLASALLAVAVRVLPSLAPWSPRAPLFLLAGVLAFCAVAATVWLFRGRVSPRVRTVEKVRRRIITQLAILRMIADATSVAVVEEAIGHVGKDILPTLRQLVSRREELFSQLASYTGDRGSPRPDPALLARLQEHCDRLGVAIDACVKQAVNAEASLVALTQEINYPTFPRLAEMWANDIHDLRDGLLDALQGKREDERRHEPELRRTAPEIAPSRGTVAPVRSLPCGLTTREVEVLRLLAGGMRSKDIAEKLVVSLSTAQRHIANIYDKIDARGRADATAWYFRHTWDDEPGPGVPSG